MTLFSKKTLLALVMMVLALGALPITAVYAASPTHLELEARFQAQQKIYARQTRGLERIQLLIDRDQKLLDRAKAKGYDTADVQAALNNLKDAIPVALPYHAEIRTLMLDHAGFNASGEVTDTALAQKTVDQIRQAKRQFRDALVPPRRALHREIRIFLTKNDLTRL